MTTTVMGNAVRFPDGTVQTTASYSTPDASEGAPGTIIYATGAEVQNKWNNDKYIIGGTLEEAQIRGAGGEGQYWGDYTSQRAAGVTYTNTTGRGMMVTLTSVISGNATYAGLRVNGVTVNEYGGDQDNGGASVCATCVVPPGSTYSATTGFSGWYELR